MFRLLPSDQDLSPRARKIRDLALVFVVFPIMVGGAAFIILDEINTRAERRELLVEVREIESSVLTSAVLIPEHDPRVVEPCLSITDPVALKELAAFFPGADDTRPGGHQTPHFKNKLRLVFGEGREAVYLIRYFDDHPDDIYLNRHRYEVYEDGSYSYSLRPIIRVPRLLPWLRKRAVQANCPAD